MGVVSFPTVASGLSTEQLADLVARMIKEVEWLANGNIDSGNVRNIAGYNVDQTTLKHSSGIVGISGADPTNNNAIRFWSGNANPAIASFRVTQGGLLTTVGAQIMSSTGYPRVELNSASALIAAYQDANNHVDVVPTSGTAPGIVWTDAGSPRAYLQASSFGFLLVSFSSGMTFQSGSYLNLNPSSSLLINGTAGQSATLSYVKFADVGTGEVDFGTLTFTKGILTGWT